ncbi:MAG: isoprenylcysteine carboxylmethyltransferase family protein [Ignavibacteriaceae bacterium]|jgi:protein-S-isoprenylcysteine O-methyltransferase Ste14|nr:isoprenylcysteine carboxylmethyltransferase family protein [Ignavibacteriaceae bacterium]
MDPINIILLINLVVTMSANASAAKRGVRISVLKVTERPESFLQKLPPNISALILILTIVGAFNVFALSEAFKEQFAIWRYIGLVIYIIFSWVQVISFKELGNSYAQDIVILKEHKLIESGIYKYIRHPQYLSQFLSDLGAGIALLSFVIIPIVILVELPLFIMRAFLEEKILLKHFKENFVAYKKKSKFMIPFIG